MIKAINRQMLEIIDTGNAYFDRAWLLISPELAGSDREILEREAAQYLFALDPPGMIKVRRRRSLQILRLIAAAVFGGLVTTILLRFYLY